MLCNAEIQPWKGQQKAAETRVPGKTSSPHLSHDFFKLLDDNSSPLDRRLWDDNLAGTTTATSQFS